jgi:hypothetical protein
MDRRKLLQIMLDWAKAIHEAIGIESPRAFIALFAIGGLVLFGFAGFIIDRGYRTKLRQDQQARAVFPNRHLRTDQAEALGLFLDKIQGLHQVKILASQRDGEAWDYAADFVRVVKRTKRLTLVGGGMFDTDIPIGGIALYLGHGEDWQKAFAAELDAAFARAQIRVHGRGVSPQTPNGQADVLIGFNDGQPVISSLKHRHRSLRRSHKAAIPKQAAAWPRG